MQDEVIEAIARGLCEAEGANWDAADFCQTPNGETPDELREYYRHNARAILPIAMNHAAGIAEERSNEWKAAIAHGLGKLSCNMSYAEGAQTEAECLAMSIRAAGEPK